MWEDAIRGEARTQRDLRFKNIKPLDGRMIIENGVMKQESWAG